jgi:hypothetical protein
MDNWNIDLKDYKFPPTLEELENLYKVSGAMDLIIGMDNLRQIKDKLEMALKTVNKEYDYIRINRLPEQMDEESIDGIRVDGIGRVSLTGDMYVSCSADNREWLKEFLTDIGKGSLITSTVNSSSLKAVVKDMMKKGEEIPEGMLNITPFTRASITKR